MTRTLIVATCVAALSGAFAAPAGAQGPVDKTTYFTFSEPVELPGYRTLAAGKYMFRLADSPSNRYIVQIFNEDGSQIFATLLAIPAQRMEPPDDPTITFMETAEGQPPAVKIWWYPGESIGREFVYPREQALRLARATSQPVLSTETTASDEESLRTAEVGVAQPSGEVTARAEAEQPEPVAPAEPAAERPVGTAGRDVDATETRTLPQTATPNGLIALAGLFSLAGALSVRAFARRRS
jgi:hypothetical protein